MNTPLVTQERHNELLIRHTNLFTSTLFIFTTLFPVLSLPPSDVIVNHHLRVFCCLYGDSSGIIAWCYRLLKKTIKALNMYMWEMSVLDCSQSPYFSVGFSRLVRFDGVAAILVCISERDLGGRVSKLPRGAGVGAGPLPLPSVV